MPRVGQQARAHADLARLRAELLWELAEELAQASTPSEIAVALQRRQLQDAWPTGTPMPEVDDGQRDVSDAIERGPNEVTDHRSVHDSAIRMTRDALQRVRLVTEERHARERAELLEQHAANLAAAATPAEVAKLAGIVFTVVSDDAAMQMIYSSGNETSLLRHAQDRLFINCATLSPIVHVELERLVEQRGGQSLEACMASSITQARQGTLYLMCGGKPNVFDRAAPVLQALGSSVRYIGAAGEAAKVKALVNMVMNCNTAALAEGLGLGAALGFDLSMLREVFSQTGASSRVLETDGEDMQHRTHDCYFSAAHAAKDSGIALAIPQRYR